MFLMTGEMQTLHPKGTPILFFNKGNHGNNSVSYRLWAPRVRSDFPLGRLNEQNDR